MDEMHQRIVQMGLRTCPVCDTGDLAIARFPTLEQIGGFWHERTHPRWDPEANSLFLVHIECNQCGHVLLFNSERLVQKGTRTLVVGRPDGDGNSPHSDSPQE